MLIQSNSSNIPNFCFFLNISSVMAAAAQGNPETATSVYDFNVKDIKGNDVGLDKYRGHVLIIVNVASKCGYTAKHYAELNELYDQFAESKGESSKDCGLTGLTWVVQLSFVCLSFYPSKHSPDRTERKENSLASTIPISFASNQIRVERRLTSPVVCLLSFILPLPRVAIFSAMYVYPRMPQHK